MWGSAPNPAQGCDASLRILTLVAARPRLLLKLYLLLSIGCRASFLTLIVLRRHKKSPPKGGLIENLKRFIQRILLQYMKPEVC